VGVGEHQRRRGLADRRRGDVHDASPSALAHARQDLADQGERCQHEVPVGGLPLLLAEAEGVRSRRRAARVRHEDVDRAERRLDLGDEGRRPGEVAAVVDEPLRAHLGGSRVDTLARTRRDGHAGALRGQLGGDRARDPLRRAHDQRHAPRDAEVHQCFQRSGFCSVRNVME
jgi:hypothetical protein